MQLLSDTMTINNKNASIWLVSNARTRKNEGSIPLADMRSQNQSDHQGRRT